MNREPNPGKRSVRKKMVDATKNAASPSADDSSEASNPLFDESAKTEPDDSGSV